ncbi:uncharacterized protein JCM15063_000879 [Sporobolomyces koalae]|uniref:uncharacterized protein n=1 Tax=Sporobolomyces koalae TaxID=500713 RepID=UPI00317660FD
MSTRLTYWPQRLSLEVLPTTTNPWEYFESQAIIIMARQAPAIFSPLLICASVLLGTTTVLFIAGVVIRWRKGTFWIFRTVRVGHERFVLPHYICSYVLLITIFNLCLQFFLWIIWFRNERGFQPKNHFLANSLPWIPGVLAVCVAVWSLTTTWVLHLRAYAFGRRPWYTTAIVVNSIGVLLPTLALATLLPFGLLASAQLEIVQNASNRLYKTLKANGINWFPGAAIESTQLSITSQLVIVVRQSLSSFGNKYEVFFSVLAGWCGLLGLMFVLVSSLYLRDLKVSIGEMRGRTKTGVETFARTYRWLVFVTVGLGISMVALAINTSWIAATLRSILGSGTVNAIAIIVPLFTVAILGLPVSVIILHNAITTPSARITSTCGERLRSDPRLRDPASTVNSKDHLENDAQRYTTQFDLAAALPLDRFAFLSMPLHDSSDPPGQVPFDSLELQPTLTNSLARRKPADGVVVERNEETFVIALPKHGADGSDSGQLEEDLK